MTSITNILFFQRELLRLMDEKSKSFIGGEEPIIARTLSSSSPSRSLSLLPPVLKRMKLRLEFSNHSFLTPLALVGYEFMRYDNSIREYGLMTIDIDNSPSVHISAFITEKVGSFLFLE